MLTRRHIRVKVMQSVYAMGQSQNQQLDKELKFLQQSANDMYRLYLLTLALFKELYLAANQQVNPSHKRYIEDGLKKKRSQRIADNQVLQLIAQNELLQDAINDHQMNLWDLDSEYIKIIYKQILESAVYQAYMAEKEVDFYKDRNFVIAIFKEIIAPNEKLYEYIEDFNLTWVDDFSIVNTFIIKLLRDLKPDAASNYFTPKLYKSDDDKLFVSELFKKVVLNDQKLQEYIEGKIQNWDKERITLLDKIIIKMAICEFTKFPSIPVKVTLNEYVEIAKEYSTAKSSIFVNGILDNLVKELEEKNELNKTGRGLL